MKTWDAETAEITKRWSEKEIMAAIGAGPKTEGSGAYEPSGKHAWFAYTIAEIVAPRTLRLLTDAWQVRPPYSDWRHHAPAIRQLADEQIPNARLPDGTTLPKWFADNEALLQEDPSQERIAIVADALLPVFDSDLACWEAINAIDGDFSRGTFSELLAGWHAQVPERCRSFVQAIATEFGLAVALESQAS